jgi:hypothetical protein
MAEDNSMTTTITRPTPTLSPPADPFETSYRRLVDARLEYEVLRERGAPLGALAEARGALHRARADMAAHRHTT